MIKHFLDKNISKESLSGEHLINHAKLNDQNNIGAKKITDIINDLKFDFRNINYKKCEESSNL